MKVGRKFNLSFAAILPLLLVLVGCNTVSQPKVDRGAPDSQSLSSAADTYRRLAQQYEKDRQLPRALFMWRVVDSLTWRDSEAREKIAQLTQTIETEGGKHFAKGREYLKQKSFLAARNEFVLALAYNPQIKEAADQVRQLSAEEEFVGYRVREGDTPERIAQTVYRDAARNFLVVYFGDLANDRQLKPGTILRLPAPDQEVRAKAVNLPRPYSNTSQRSKPYDKAEAEVHYSKGVGHYLGQQYREAIKEWEETLRLDPEHPNARRDIQKTRAMLRKTRSK